MLYILLSFWTTIAVCVLISCIQFIFCESSLRENSSYVVTKNVQEVSEINLVITPIIAYSCTWHATCTASP